MYAADVKSRQYFQDRNILAGKGFKVGGYYVDPC